MTKIKLKNQSGELLETMKIKSTPTRFILIRGRLFEWDTVQPDEYEYTERPYLEIN